MGKKGVCELEAGEAVGHPWNTEASGSHMACEIAIVGNKHNVSISMVDDECKDVRGEIKEALDQEGKEEQQEGSGEIPGSDDSQKSLNTLQTHAHVPDRRVAGQDEGRGDVAMVLCNAVLEGSVQGTKSFSEQVPEASKDLKKTSGMNLPCSLAVEESFFGTIGETPLRRQKMKGFCDVVKPSTHPRRSVRLSEKASQARKSTLVREGSLPISISDGHIGNCNYRIRKNKTRENPTKLWDQGKQIGLVCRGDEEEVIQEYQCLEDKDLKFMKSIAEGSLNGFL